jgi:hypothetical protein
MRRQQPISLLTPLGRLDDLIHQNPREGRRQNPKRHPVTEPLPLLEPHLTRPWHTPRIPRL